MTKKTVLVILTISTIICTLPILKGPTFVYSTVYPTLERLLGGYPLHLWTSCPLVGMAIDWICMSISWRNLLINETFWILLFSIIWFLFDRFRKLKRD